MTQTPARRHEIAMDWGGRACRGEMLGNDKIRDLLIYFMHEMPAAWQFNGEDRCDWPEWLREHEGIHIFRRPNGTVEYLTFDNPRMVCHQGNWIIRNGEDVIVCLPDPLLAEAEQGLI